MGERGGKERERERGGGFHAQIFSQVNFKRCSRADKTDKGSQKVCSHHKPRILVRKERE